ncbi:hypothetical protein DFH08DRAFT_816618 [Mycena albidolilacea]|uniref:Uncharacterized protein n=1 Tax=Mycena albidolilacea TaxID=1033008 RepID=A0AAD6ZJN8_9AGAR|nr:hypothetical protein DFH08DRAFT_816618 [Mycena albidolilacea]
MAKSMDVWGEGQVRYAEVCSKSNDGMGVPVKEQVLCTEIKFRWQKVWASGVKGSKSMSVWGKGRLRWQKVWTSGKGRVRRAEVAPTSKTGSPRFPMKVRSVGRAFPVKVRSVGRAFPMHQLYALFPGKYDQLDALFPGKCVLIPFIPSSILQYIAVVLTSISLAVYLAYHSTPTRQVGRLDAAAKEVKALFEVATGECVADPRFVYEAGLKLSEMNYAVSTLRLRTIGMKYMSWKGYAHHLRAIASSIEECWRELEELRSSVLHRDNRKDRIQPAAPLPDQPPDERPAVFEVCSGKPPTASTDGYPRIGAIRNRIAVFEAISKSIGKALLPPPATMNQKT